MGRNDAKAKTGENKQIYPDEQENEDEDFRRRGLAYPDKLFRAGVSLDLLLEVPEGFVDENEEEDLMRR